MYKYKNVPIETPKDHCVDILRNNEAQHPCDPRFGPPFPPHPEKHPNDK